MKKHNNFFKYIKLIPFCVLLSGALFYLFWHIGMMKEVVHLRHLFGTEQWGNPEFGWIYSSPFIFSATAIVSFLLNLITIIVAILVYPKNLWGATAILVLPIVYFFIYIKVFFP